MADVHERSRPEGALALVEQAPARYAETGHRAGAAHTHLVAARAWESLGEDRRAEDRRQRAGALFTQIGGLITDHADVLFG